METLPLLIPAGFILTTALTVFLFYKASSYSRTTLVLLLAWLTLQGLVASSGFYQVTNTIPPRFALLVVPPLVFITMLFATAAGRRYIDQLNTADLTLLHIIRIPVELVLFGLFIHRLVPELMTFEGRNFDILSGITAPFIFYFGYRAQKLNKIVLIIWNVICLLLLFNIVTHAILSLPTPFQQLAFDQPNRALTLFPFIWLPACLVPLVLFSHLATLRQLTSNSSTKL